jgi:hypothetical protein
MKGDAVGVRGKKKKQIDVNHIQEGIGHGHTSSGLGEGEHRDGKWRRDKKALHVG